LRARSSTLEGFALFVRELGRGEAAVGARPLI
jgi:hypothetical protein